MKQWPGSYTVASLLAADMRELEMLRGLLDPDCGKG